MDAKIVRFAPDQHNVAKCEGTTLRWSVENASHVFIDGAEQPSSGSVEVRPLHTTGYELRADGRGGLPVFQRAEVTVAEPRLPGPPACGEIVWTGNVRDDGQIKMEARAGGLWSDPPAVSAIGNLPHSKVTVAAEENSVRVLSQPYQDGRAAVALECDKHGLNTVRLWWALVKSGDRALLR